MGFAWTHDLRLHKLDYSTLCSIQNVIDTLVRQVTAGALFESDTSAFFLQNVEPLLVELFKSLHRVYDDKEAVPVTSAQLSFELLELCDALQSDVDAALCNDPATDDPIEVVFAYPGFKAISYNRVAHCFYKHGIPLIPRLISERAHTLTGIDIHPGARIGRSCFIDHGTGVVIGETAVIGDHVTIYQGVTLGAKRFQRAANGVVIKGESRHPLIEDGVTIYAGATILGRIVVGANSVIGGNVWLTESVPAGSRLTQQRYQSSSFIDGDGI